VQPARQLSKNYYRYAPEDVITTPFRRALVDVDDTVPVALYTRPYERLEIQVESRPYELIEIEQEVDLSDDLGVAPMPSPALRIVLTISVLACSLVLGFELALLLL
jgi:hypothetical protein